jgi:hypothetical protein
MNSIRKAGNTGITGGIKGINNKVPKTTTKPAENHKKPASGGWKPDHKPANHPTKPPNAR